MRLVDPAFGVTAILAAACTERPLTTSNGERSALAGAITEGVAARVGPDGKFALDPPQLEERPIVPEETARQIAVTTAVRLGPMIGVDLQFQHRGPIDFSRLSDCGRAYFARGPFESIPQGLPPEMVYYLGSQWLIAICAPSGTPVISVAVAANATEVVRVQGGVFGPPNSVSMAGIPPEWDGALPISPEHAVILASGRTGRRIASVPSLYAPNPRDAFPQGANWVFDAESEVALRGEKSGAVSSSVHLLVGSAQDPSNAWLRGPVDLYIARPDGRRVVPYYWPSGTGLIGADLRVSPEIAVDIEQATVVVGGRP